MKNAAVFESFLVAHHRSNSIFCLPKLVTMAMVARLRNCVFIPLSKMPLGYTNVKNYLTSHLLRSVLFLLPQHPPPPHPHHLPHQSDLQHLLAWKKGLNLILLTLHGTLISFSCQEWIINWLFTFMVSIQKWFAHFLL